MGEEMDTGTSGDERVDEALGALKVLAETPVTGHVEAFAGLEVTGRRCLDAGASTGGFTDVLLRAGAAHVVAVDVGYGQIAWSLRTDERVTVVERLNIRDMTPEHVGEPPSVVVGDLSFISLTKVLEPIKRCVAP